MHKAWHPVSQAIVRGFASSAASAEGGRTWRFWLPTLAVGGVSASGAVWLATSEHPTSSAKLVVQFPLRLARDVATAAATVADYQLSLRGLEGEAREAEKRQCHRRGADRLQRLCFANGGIYIKLGQHVAQLDHLLPGEYVRAMRQSMLDKCPVEKYEQVARTISEDLGRSPDELFASFERQPIASASLAQVHKAVGHDGRQLAVKVQHAGLRDSFAADAFTVEVLVDLVQYLFPDFNYRWLVHEVKHSLPKELDFEMEADNAERCAANLASPLSSVAGLVTVPAILRDLSSARVLTMEFIDGIEVTNREQLQRAGIAPGKIARIVSDAFNDMIFMYGDVHCDPHSANLFVRQRNGQEEVVLLDHGLYRQIDDNVRLHYAGLWQALVLGDVPKIERHAQGLNAGDAVPIFAGLLTARPWNEVTNRNSINHLALTGTQSERDELQGYAQQYAKEISSLLWRVPKEVLLLLKTNDCLRTVDLALGQPVNTFIIMARTCTRAIARHRSQERPGFRSWILKKLDLVKIESRILSMRAVSWYAATALPWLLAVQRWLMPWHWPGRTAS